MDSMRTTAAASPSSHERAAQRARDFAALFPRCVSREASAAEREVTATSPLDLSVDALVLRPLEEVVETGVYDALCRWNAHEPAKTESTMAYMERLKRYRTIARWLLYDEEEEEEKEEEGAVPQDSHSAKRKRAGELVVQRRRNKQRKSRQREQAVYREIFAALPDVGDLRHQRQPCDRLRAFASQFPVKKHVLSQRRSLADTKSSLCFEFARPTPLPRPAVASSSASASASSAALLTEQKNGLGGDDETAMVNAAQERTPLAVPTATTAATWRTRTLLASVVQQEKHQAAKTHERMQTEATLELDADADADEDDDEPGPDTTVVRGREPGVLDLLLWVDVLHPGKDPARTQSFLVWSSQHLTDLLDLVACAFDQRLDMHARHSKLLYFDAQFYVDQRHDDHVDYATQILQWIHACPRRQAKYLGDASPGTLTDSLATRVHALENTTFADLALKLDTPGVYIHQGECEHLLRLRDVRMPHTDDVLSASAREAEFPMRLPNMLYRQLRNCLICQHYSAKFVTYGDRLSISDPMFFCERCYRAAHYDADGQLVYNDFQVFPFVQE